MIARRWVALTLAAIATACDWARSPLEPDPASVALDEIILLSQTRTPAVMPADGESVDTIRAHLPSEAKPTTVQFRTTLGRFQGAETPNVIDVRVVPGADGMVAEAVLVAADSAGVAEVRGVVSGFTALTTVAMTPIHEGAQ